MRIAIFSNFHKFLAMRQDAYTASYTNRLNYIKITFLFSTLGTMFIDIITI